MTIGMEKWGKDHWSTLAYIETRVVDHRGTLDNLHMRCHSKRHPQFAHTDGSRYPTRLKGGEVVADHDDWDCVDDLEVAGLVKGNGTGLHPIFALTPLGKNVAAQLRQHKAEGKSFSAFDPTIPPSSEVTAGETFVYLVLFSSAHFEDVVHRVYALDHSARAHASKLRRLGYRRVRVTCKRVTQKRGRA